MKKSFIVFGAVLITAAFCGCSRKPKSDLDQASYFVGQQIGHNLKKQDLSLNRGMIVQGVMDALDEKAPALDRGEMRKAQDFFNRIVSERISQVAQTNLKSATGFLEENKRNPGWATTASGLQYKILRAGKGRRPAASDTVLVNYIGTLMNGQKFDSSQNHGSKPAEFKVSGVIKGWSEALQLMPEGSHWAIVLPASLAYGSAGNGIIPPHAVLVFDVELVKIK